MMIIILIVFVVGSVPFPLPHRRPTMRSTNTPSCRVYPSVPCVPLQILLLQVLLQTTTTTSIRMMILMIHVLCVEHYPRMVYCFCVMLLLLLRMTTTMAISSAAASAPVGVSRVSCGAMGTIVRIVRKRRIHLRNNYNSNRPCATATPPGRVRPVNHRPPCNNNSSDYWQLVRR